MVVRAVAAIRAKAAGADPPLANISRNELKSTAYEDLVSGI